MIMKKKLIFFCAAVAAVMAAIFVFSSKEVGISLGQSGRLTRLICRIIFFRFDELTVPQQDLIVTELDFFVRKLAHFSVYMLLGICTYGAVMCMDRVQRKQQCALLICAAYAALDELHQRHVPGRTGQLPDVFIDSAGALLGIAVLWVARAVYRQLKEKKPK